MININSTADDLLVKVMKDFHQRNDSINQTDICYIV